MSTANEAATGTSEAPISQLLPLISKSASFFLASIPAIASGLVAFLSKLSYLILLVFPLSIILYAISPFVVFSQVAFDILVVTPYTVALYVLDALYPIYVFLGVACITGVLVGFGGRTLAVFLTTVVLGSADRATSSVVAKRVEEKAK
jgi:hypothetical protein